MARPQEFDRQEVIKAAIDVFQKHGYAATSVPDLVKATGLQPGSLYAAFGNKKGILVEALDFYLEQTLESIERCFAAEECAVEGIRCFLREVVNTCHCEQGRYGCLIVNSLLEMGPEDEELEAHLQKLIGLFEAKFSNQISKAQELGQLDQSLDPDVLGKYLVCNLWGLRVMAKTQPDTKTTEALVDQLLSHLDRCCPEAA